MYTILINDDLSLTTSIKTTLLRGTTTDQIGILLPLESLENPSDDDTQQNPQVTVTKRFSALLRYETDNVMKTEALVTDEELYKGRTRFILPRSASFFNNRGLIQLWFEVTTDITTTTTTYDDETGEIIDETTETETEIYTTLPTTLFIDEVPHEHKCPNQDDNNTIRITRGDSLTINVALTDDDGFPYEPVEGDVVIFTVKKSAIAEDVLIQKNIDIETLVLELVEADTKNLAFGTYRYEVECVTAQDDHYTVIKNAPFIITEELH